VNKGHLSTVAIGQSKVYPNPVIRACIMAMYQIIQEVSTEIAIFMTVAKLDKRILFFFFII